MSRLPVQEKQTENTLNHLLKNQRVHTFSNKASKSRPNLVALIHRRVKEENRTFLLSADIKKSWPHQCRLSERKSSTSGNSHRSVIFPILSKIHPDCYANTGGSQNPGLFEKSLVIRLLKQGNNTKQCTPIVSYTYTHRQASHILKNMWSSTFWSTPPTSKLCQHTLPNNCARVGKELQLCFAVGWAW